jgi:hypothetical protein
VLDSPWLIGLVDRDVVLGAGSGGIGESCLKKFVLLRLRPFATLRASAVD